MLTLRPLTHNRDLKLIALEALAGNWGKAALAYLIYTLIISAVSFIPFAGSIVCLLIAGPFLLGWTIFMIRLVRNEPTQLEDIFSGFKDFGRGLRAYLLMTIYTLLWALLLIIPGIMAAYAYSLTYFILYDNPGMKVNDAISLSRKLMYGHRWKYFCLSMRFIGWAFLCLFTCGIASFWVMPYMLAAFAAFYEDIRMAVTPPPVEEEVIEILA